MGFKTVKIENLRCLRSLDLEFDNSIILIHGKNGSGKSSIIEALSLLIHGKSYRTSRNQQIITHGQTSANLFATMQQDGLLNRIGIKKSLDGINEIHLNGKRVLRQAEITQTVPLWIISEHQYQLLSLESNYRRKLIEWLLFYADKDYFTLWHQYSNQLQQRNHLIRQINNGHKANRREIEIWNDLMAESGQKLNQRRSDIVAEMGDHIRSCVTHHQLPIAQYELRYQQGWKSDTDLRQYLNSQWDRDLQLGYTAWGPHRFDFNFHNGKNRLADYLSRGEIKVVSLLLIKTILQLFKLKSQRELIIAMDDHSSELDIKNQQHLLHSMAGLAQQIFITAINGRDFIQNSGSNLQIQEIDLNSIQPAERL
jgi:DNA replication and repair protein RecF